MTCFANSTPPGEGKKRVRVRANTYANRLYHSMLSYQVRGVRVVFCFCLSVVTEVVEHIAQLGRCRVALVLAVVAHSPMGSGGIALELAYGQLASATGAHLVRQLS